MNSIYYLLYTSSIGKQCIIHKFWSFRSVSHFQVCQCWPAMPLALAELSNLASFSNTSTLVSILCSILFSASHTKSLSILYNTNTSVALWLSSETIFGNLHHFQLQQIYNTGEGWSIHMDAKTDSTNFINK